jgi:hypothetical protein
LIDCREKILMSKIYRYLSIQYYLSYFRLVALNPKRYVIEVTFALEVTFVPFGLGAADKLAHGD